MCGGWHVHFRLLHPQSLESASDLGFLITDSYTTENCCLCCLSPTQLPIPTSKLLIFGMQMHSPSLIWNLKMMVYKGISGISYSFWCHSQVKHVKNVGRVHPFLGLIPGFNYSRRRNLEDLLFGKAFGTSDVNRILPATKKKGPQNASCLGSRGVRQQKIQRESIYTLGLVDTKYSIRFRQWWRTFSMGTVHQLRTLCVWDVEEFTFPLKNSWISYSFLWCEPLSQPGVMSCEGDMFTAYVCVQIYIYVYVYIYTHKYWPNVLVVPAIGALLSNLPSNHLPVGWSFASLGVLPLLRRKQTPGDLETSKQPTRTDSCTPFCTKNTHKQTW